MQFISIFHIAKTREMYTVITYNLKFKNEISVGKNSKYTNTKYITFPWRSLKPQISVEGSHYTLMYVSLKAILYFMWFKESYENFFSLHKEVGKRTSWNHPHSPRGWLWNVFQSFSLLEYYQGFFCTYFSYSNCNSKHKIKS